MNKTLLLIICDFLLLNLLALTRWEQMEPVPPQKVPVPQVKANIAAHQSQDLVEAMKLALEGERATRDQTLAQMQAQQAQLKASLSQTRQTLAAKEAEAERQRQTLSSAVKGAEAEREKLASQMQQSLAAKQAEIQRQQQMLAALEQQKAAIQQQTSKLQATQAEKDLLREQMERQLQQSLAEKQAEIERQQKALAALEGQRNVAIQQASNLVTAVKVAETERNLLRENVDHLKGEVAVVRQEKEKLQTQTTKLAEGVTQLAVKSGELTQEIRENTPINMNLMFGEFLSNRVNVTITALAPGLFSPSLRQKDTQTVLVRDGKDVYALLHISETPFSLTIPATGMSIVSAWVSTPIRELAKGPLHFLGTDPRVVLIPVEPPPKADAGLKIYAAARNPFKFTEAVLISRGGKYYGEVEFRLDPRTPNYVRMKNRLFNRLFGEFSPSTGDLVLSKTGELLGVMVNPDYCAVFKEFVISTSDSFDERTIAETMRPKLEEFRRRLDWLPFAVR